MMKVLGFIPRRPDVSRDAFRHYYETQHVLLALTQIREFSKYVRNHVVSAVPREVGYDCFPEWWFEGPEVAAAIAARVASSVGEILHRDEANFMDRPRMGFCGVADRLLFGPARGVEPWLTRKVGLLITRAASASVGDFESELERFGKDLLHGNAGRFVRVGLDVPLDQFQANLPLHAVFWIWPTSAETSVYVPHAGGAIAGVTELTIDAIETPPVALHG